VGPERPTTGSAKIWRGLLTAAADTRVVGAATTLADSTVMDLIKKGLAGGAAED
jgi:acetyl-CoA synthetase